MATRQTQRTRLAVVLLAGMLAVTGCGRLPSRGSDRADPGTGGTPDAGSPTAPAEPTYELVTEPCQVLSGATVSKFALKSAQAQTLDGFGLDPDTRIAVPAANVECNYSIDNPANGPNGKSNYASYSLTYQVVDPTVRKSVQVARDLFVEQKTKATSGTYLNHPAKVVGQDSPAGLGEEAFYVYLDETTSLGGGGTSLLVIRVRNALVRISLSAADLYKDPSKKVGFQLFTKTVPETRLKPTVVGTAEEALARLK